MLTRCSSSKFQRRSWSSDSHAHKMIMVQRCSWSARAPLSSRAFQVASPACKRSAVLAWLASGPVRLCSRDAHGPALFSRAGLVRLSDAHGPVAPCCCFLVRISGSPDQETLMVRSRASRSVTMSPRWSCAFGDLETSYAVRAHNGTCNAHDTLLVQCCFGYTLMLLLCAHLWLSNRSRYADGHLLLCPLLFSGGFYTPLPDMTG